jgi:hypothetical protein
MEVPAHLQAVLAWWLGGREGPAPAYDPPEVAAAAAVAAALAAV